MSENITLQITRADIDKAVVKDSSRCAVAQSVARTIPDAQRISVDVQAIRFTSGGDRHTYLTPPSVAGYVVAFDAGDPLAPFRCILRKDQHLVTRRARAPLTKAGKATHGASTAVRQAKASVARAEAKVDQLKREQAAPRRIAQAEAKVEEKREEVDQRAAERDAVVAAYTGQRKYEATDTTLPPAIPKVFKRKERAYGMRQLRINQQDG